MSLFQSSAITLTRRGSSIFKVSPQYYELMKISHRFEASIASTETISPINDGTKILPFNEIPSLGVYSVLRNSLPGGKYFKKNIDEILDLMKKEHGDVIYIPGLFGKEPMVLTFNSNDFEIVFRNEGVWPERRGLDTLDYYRSVLRKDFFKGCIGLVTSQGDQWGSFRSVVNPILMQPKNMRMYYKKMSQVNREFVEKIRQVRDPATQEMPADFESIINQWTLESVSIVAFDRELGLLRDDNVDPTVQKLFDSINEFILLSSDMDTKPSIWRIIATPKYKRMMKALDNVLEVTSFFVSEAMQRIEAEKKSGVEKPENQQGALEKMLEIDPQIAKVMAMDLLFGGTDTSSSAFAGIMLCLAKNPEKQEKLREELRRILPQKDSEFTEQSLNDMSYLRACIKEAFRVYPLVPMYKRVVQQDVVISGYHTPKGTDVCMFMKSMNYDENYYARPNEFLPERWMRDESQKCPNSLKSNNPFVYLPFGFGPRSCIGRRIAEMELELGVARIIRNFNVSFNYPTYKAFKMLLFNVPNIPLKFQMTDVES